MDRQRGLKRELQQLLKPKEKASGQLVRSQGMAGTSTAWDQEWLQGRLELQGEKDRLSVRAVRSSRTSSAKIPSLCPLRCTNASHQYQAGGWDALGLPSHGNGCAAGIYLPPLTKTPCESPRCAMGPMWQCPALASSRQGSSCYQGTARSSAVLSAQLGPVERGWRSSQWNSLSGQILLQTTTKETINKEKELKFNQSGRKALPRLKAKNWRQFSFYTEESASLYHCKSTQQEALGHQ